MLYFFVRFCRFQTLSQIDYPRRTNIILQRGNIVHLNPSFRKHFNRLLCCCCADHQFDGGISHSGPASYCGGSMCAGNNSRGGGGGTALLSDDPTVITHRSNSRRQNTITTTVNRRNHNETHRNAEAEYPLNEIHQQKPQTLLEKQSSC